MTPERLFRIQQTLSKRQSDLTVLTDDVHKQHNFSAIIRSCDAFSVQNVHAIWSRDSYQTYRGRAMGSQNWVTVNQHDSIEVAISSLKNKGLKICAASFSDRAIDYRSYDFTQPTALLMGNEKHGVSSQAAELADEHLIIPMQGMVQSFNVSVAAAILLSEAITQRAKAKTLTNAPLDDQEYQTLLFEWCQPVIAEFCRDRHLPYPELNDEGEVVNPQKFSQLLNTL